MTKDFLKDQVKRFVEKFLSLKPAELGRNQQTGKRQKVIQNNDVHTIG